MNERGLAWVRNPIVLAMALGCALSLVDIGRSFWRDEAVSMLYASRPIEGLFEYFVEIEASTAIHYLLLHFWLGIGESEVWARLLSVAVGVATVLPVAAVARRIAGPWAGAAAAFVFATMPFVVRFNQETRAYSLSMLCTAMLAWLLLRAVERPTAGRWLSYGCLAAIGMFVHFFVAFVVAANMLYLLVSRSIPRGAALVALGVPLAIGGGLLLAAVAGQRHLDSFIAWIPAVVWDDLSRELVRVAGGSALAITLAAFAIYGLVVRYREPRMWMLVLWLVLPFAIALTFSLAVQPVLVSRYLAVSIPALAILAGIGVGTVAPRRGRVASALLLAVLVVAANPTGYARPIEDWRSATSWIADEAHEGDRIAFGSDTGRTVAFYVARHDPDVALEPVTNLEAIRPDGRRLWTTSYLADERASFVERMEAAGFELVEGRSWTGVWVDLYEPADP